jgi:hypothetical protein
LGWELAPYRRKVAWAIAYILVVLLAGVKYTRGKKAERDREEGIGSNQPTDRDILKTLATWERGKATIADLSLDEATREQHVSMLLLLLLWLNLAVLKTIWSSRITHGELVTE